MERAQSDSAAATTTIRNDKAPSVHCDSATARFAALYKFDGRLSERQEERRVMFLRKQRENRNERYDQLLKLLEEENFQDSDNDASDDEREAPLHCEVVEAMQIDKPKSEQQQRASKRYLMRSEWLTSVPSDFLDNYLAIACPRGKRCLVTTWKNHTRALTSRRRRHAILPSKFLSLLPGGNPSSAKAGRRTVLDCVFADGVFYALDMLCWAGMPMIECTFECRHALLEARLSETQCARVSPLNRFPILTLAALLPSVDTLTRIASRANSDVPLPLDGLLFYHKEGFYVSGYSPLVCWTEPQMLSDLFGIEVDKELYPEK